MIGYIVYFHEDSDHSFQTEEFAAFDDTTAELYAERFAGHGPLELWHGNRLVKRWSGDINKPPKADPVDDLSAL